VVPLITVSGLPGAGTTTVAQQVAVATGLDHADAGSLFRRLAAERGMTVAELGRYATEHPEVDVELDARTGERARQAARGGPDEGCVLEGRLAGWVATREGVGALRVWVACRDEVRAERVARREGSSPAEALAQNRSREASERDRYARTYGIDLADLAFYDLVLDSESATPDELAAAILDRLEGG